MTHTEANLFALIASITPPDSVAACAARERQAKLAKPPGSLGRLEDLSVQLAGITGQVHNKIEKKRLLVFAADNGVIEEGVASAPQSVTLMQTVNLTRGKTGASALARYFGNELYVYDVGVNAEIRESAVINRKIAYGTHNIVKSPAMTREQAVEALFIGLEAAADAAADGVDVIGVGEMGICNTTTSSAVIAALTGSDPAAVTGRGGGITDESYQKKLSVIRTALETHKPNRCDPVDVLAKVGGFDLAAMTGAFIGAAAAHMPAVIDGFISVAAALCATRLSPLVREYLVPSHASYEIGYRVAMGELGLEPVLNLGMRLGEGSGCPLAFEVLSAACAVINGMATFEEAGIDDGYLDVIRKTDSFTVKGTGDASGG